MENICKDQVREIVEFELSGEPVEGTINNSKGSTEKIEHLLTINAGFRRDPARVL